MFVNLLTANFKFRNRSTCSKEPVKWAGKVCGDSQDLKSPGKIQLKKSEVTYMGNIIGNRVVKPDYEKVRAIVEMPAPTCKKDIQRLLVHP